MATVTIDEAAGTPSYRRSWLIHGVRHYLTLSLFVSTYERLADSGLEPVRAWVGDEVRQIISRGWAVAVDHDGVRWPEQDPDRVLARLEARWPPDGTINSDDEPWFELTPAGEELALTLTPYDAPPAVRHVVEPGPMPTLEELRRARPMPMPRVGRAFSSPLRQHDAAPEPTGHRHTVVVPPSSPRP